MAARRGEGRAAQMRAGAGEPDLYHASMDTGHYSFDGYGKSPDEAKAALRSGFHKHLKQVGMSLPEWRARNGHRGDPLDFYGANVQGAYSGGAVRDRDQQLNGHPNMR